METWLLVHAGSRELDACEPLPALSKSILPPAAEMEHFELIPKENNFTRSLIWNL